MCPKVRQVPYKIRRKAVQNQWDTGICRGCTLPVFTRKCPANAWISRSNCCFFVLFVPLPVEAGFGCSWLVASNVFVRTKPYLLILKKNNAPHECGNPKCKVIALGWLSDERFPCDHRHQPAASEQTGGQGAIALGIRRRCRTASTRIRRAMPCSIVKAAALYTNWLAPGFNIDSRSRQAQFYQSPNSQEPNFRAKAVESDRSLTSIPNNSYGTLAKTIKTINCLFLPPSYVYLTWLAMRLPYLLRGLRRIYKGLKYKKPRQKQQFFTKNDKHLYWVWG